MSTWFFFCRWCTFRRECTLREERQKWNINAFDCFMFAKSYAQASYVILFDKVCLWTSHKKIIEADWVKSMHNKEVYTMKLYLKEGCLYRKGTRPLKWAALLVRNLSVVSAFLQFFPAIIFCIFSVWLV